MNTVTTRHGRRIAAGLLGAAVMTLTASPSAAAPITVKTGAGALRGDSGSRQSVFRGIPYAAPPVGALRWAPPQAPASWKGVRAATTFGAICEQKLNTDGTPNTGGAVGPASEDCLFLNVAAPAGAVKAPVMVWLHGGGNTTGAGSLGAYDGGAFTRDGIVLITVNYRLGLLGFFAHPALTKAAQPEEPLVSYGLMDQIAALKWVKRNIAAFGGDPDNVTLFGESAGAIDSLALMTIASAKGLFAKTIIESGFGWSAPVALGKAEAMGAAVAVKAGAPADATAVQLRALPVAAIAGLALGTNGAVTDGRLLTEAPTQAFAAGHAMRVPMIIGSNSYEASLMKTMKLPSAAVLMMAPAPIKTLYADLPGDDLKAAQIFTDSFVGAPARWIAGQTTDNRTWLYQFAYVPQMARASRPGAGHASEIPFVFESWDHLGVLSEGIKPTADDLAVTRKMHACWVAFAKTGVPACDGAPAWPAYTAANDILLDFDADGVAKLKTGFRKAQYDAETALTIPTLGLTAPTAP